MYDIEKINIWKKEERRQESGKYLKADIAELNLSTRAFNCLKRAGCNTVGEICEFLDEEGNGLRNIRNLGAGSEKEILEHLRKYQEEHKYEKAAESDGETPEGIILGPKVLKRSRVRENRNLWEADIEGFHLSNYALNKLRISGIRKVKDLYATNPKNEPGWYAVRELFEKI